MFVHFIFCWVVRFYLADVQDFLLHALLSVMGLATNFLLIPAFIVNGSSGNPEVSFSNIIAFIDNILKIGT